MSLFKRLCCCCLSDKEIEVNDSTRLLPKTSSDDKLIKRVESPFTLYSYGVLPSDLHLKLIPDDFCKLGISKIACGSQHFLLLSETNFVIAAGNNEFGQCARDPQELIETEEGKKEFATSLKMTAFNIDKHRVLDIAAGANHSAVLVKAENNYSNTTQTKVMVWGSPLGCGFVEGRHRHTPSEVIVENLKEDIKAVFAGQNRSAVLTESGKVFVWGEWFTGTKQVKPKELMLSYPVKKLAIGKMFISALTEIGKVFAVGDNTYGELGLGREVKTTLRFVEVREVSQVIDVAAGARHTLYLTRDHRVFSTGDNSESQCANVASRSYLPVEVNLKSLLGSSHPEKVFCGEAHSAILTNDGEVYVWGDNTAGRLGIKGPMSIEKPRILEDVIGKYVTGVGLGGLFTTVLVGPSTYNLARRSHISEQLIPPN